MVDLIVTNRREVRKEKLTGKDAVGLFFFFFFLFALMDSKRKSSRVLFWVPALGFKKGRVKLVILLYFKFLTFVKDTQN